MPCLQPCQLLAQRLVFCRQLGHALLQSLHQSVRTGCQGRECGSNGIGSGSGSR